MKTKENDTFKTNFQKPIKEFIITVPSNYDRLYALLNIREQNRLNSKFVMSQELTDANYNNPSSFFIPGATYEVKMYLINLLLDPTDCVSICKSNKVSFFGAQGIALIYETKREHLLKNYYMIGLDKQANLWKTHQDVGYPYIQISGSNSCTFSQWYLKFNTRCYFPIFSEL